MISLNWVKDYIDIDGEDVNELAVKITKAGVNIEKVINSRIDNLVIGKVIECKKHSDSDHLNVCKVDIGNEVTQIVCGASNVRAGIKVLVALPGCILPGDVLIKAGKIRGEESNGMICALFELGLEEKNEKNYAKGIAEIETDLKPGDDANKYLGTDDTIYELDVHKHRNNDCYYHIGFAYEIASILSKDVKLPSDKHNEIEDNVNDYVSLSVETEKCPYYTLKMVRDVEIKESPEFIKKRLLAAGMRPINNVVDISNYVMLEYGQPLHFFDMKKLGSKILVRQAFKEENIKTLDGQDRILMENDIVITDGNKPVCIAGVMGGENTDVDDNTKDILIEAAIFDAINIRNTANRLNLKSEASIRYGKGLNYEYTDKAMERACYLLEKYANAKICSGKIVYDKVDKTDKIVKFRTEEVNKLLGLKLTNSDVETQLNRLMFSYDFKDDMFIVTIPKRRLDIDPNVNDIAEEIGRLYGYDNLEATLPFVTTKRGVYVGDVKIRKEISKRLRSLGLNETKTYTLVSPDMAKLFKYDNKEILELPNPMSIDKSVIRNSIIPSLINVYEYNKARNVKDILLYEIAKTYDKQLEEEMKVAILISGNYVVNDWQHEMIKCDFYTLKGIVENLLNNLGFKNRYNFEKMVYPEMHPGMSAKIVIDKDEVGVIGRVHPQYNKDDIYVCELSVTKLYNKQIKAIKFKESSKYPEVVKDVAFIVSNDVLSEDIRKQIIKSGGRLLTNVSVFDLYPNIQNGKNSIPCKLTFSDLTRTLTDDEVMNVFNKIIDEVTTNCNVKLRDN